MMRAALVAVAMLIATASAAVPHPDFTPEIGSRLDLDLRLTDADGRTDRLGAFTGGKPALVLFGYHRCPNLCGIAQLDLAGTLAATGLAGSAYSVVFVSVDPHETATDAAQSRHKLATAAPGLDLDGWHFLVGAAPAITALEASVGMTVSETARDFYVHPVAVSALTPDGRLSRVLSGLDYTARDLRLAIVEASAGRLGTLGEHILLLCSGFDLATGRYTGTVMTAVRFGSVAVMLGLGGAVLLMLQRKRA